MDAELGLSTGATGTEVAQAVKLIVSASATADLLRLQAFLSELNPDAAGRAASIIIQGINSLELFPDRARPSPIAGVRELVVPFGGSAYIIRFAHDPERGEVVVVRIWHGREARS